MSDHLKIKNERLPGNGRGDFTGIAADCAHDLGKLGEAVKGLATDSLDNVREEIVGFYKKGEKRMTSMEGRLESSIRSHPIKAVLIAAGVGGVIAGVAAGVGWFNSK